MWSTFDNLDIADGYGGGRGRGRCWEGYDGEDCYDSSDRESAGCKEAECILNAAKGVVHDEGRSVAIRSAKSTLNGTEDSEAQSWSVTRRRKVAGQGRQ